jgi:hypothetical protein
VEWLGLLAQTAAATWMGNVLLVIQHAFNPERIAKGDYLSVESPVA